jgi:elongation factor P
MGTTMKISGNDIRCGNILDYNKKLWVVTKIQHVQPGKGGAYVQVEMKNILEGTKLHERFRSSETVEKVHLDTRPFQFLYSDANELTFMDQETFEQLVLNVDFVGDSAVYLSDGMMVEIACYEERPVSLKLPDSVVLEVREAEPVVKGQTASSSFKPAILENGVRTMVPPHIEVGAKIVVNTLDSTYVERAKGL